MLTYLRTSIFESPAQTLVNTVNVIGVMGKGIAKEFKAHYPEMFAEYKKLCDDRQLKIGFLHLWRGPDNWVLNFPTKTTWKKPSQLSFIRDGLEKFVQTYESMGITSVSFPPLGCGNGNLDWDEVRPVMESYLRNLPIPVYVHDKQVSCDFVPEHLEQASEPPMSFETFLRDIVEQIKVRHGAFKTLQEGTDFIASLTDDNSIRISRSNGGTTIPAEEIEDVWTLLHTGLLTIDQFATDSSRRYKSYLFSILSSLPYVRCAEIQHIRDSNKKHGLFFVAPSGNTREVVRQADSQPTLWDFR